jgi:hypothetical protein
VSTPDHHQQHSALAAMRGEPERCLIKSQEISRCLAYSNGNIFPIEAPGDFKSAISEVSVHHAMCLLESLRFCGAAFPANEECSVLSSRAVGPQIREILIKVDAVVAWDRKDEVKGGKGAGTVARSSGYSRVQHGLLAPHVAFADDPVSLRLCTKVAKAAREQAAKMSCAAACVGWGDTDQGMRIAVVGMSDVGGTVRLVQRCGTDVHEASKRGQRLPSEAYSHATAALVELSGVVGQPWATSGSGTGAFGLDVESAIWGAVRAAETLGAVYPEESLTSDTRQILKLRGVTHKHALVKFALAREESR